MVLRLADSGCCQGHLCDDCTICQRGRCCRNDNPQYELPKLGDWDGPVYGSLGRLTTDGDKVECHACGVWLTQLSMHTLWAHDLMAREYKAVFGLRQTEPLISARTRSKLSRASKDAYAAGAISGIGPGKGNLQWLASTTKEQQSAIYERRRYTGLIDGRPGRRPAVDMLRATRV